MNKWENYKDLGIKPSHGLVPTKLSTREANFIDNGEWMSFGFEETWSIKHVGYLTWQTDTAD